MNKSSIFCIILFLHFFVLAKAQKVPISKVYHKVNEALEVFQTDKELKNASYGFLAIDMNSKEVIAEANADLALQSASTLKIFSTSTILELLGANMKYKTDLAIDGEMDTLKHILNGNLIIIGGGDPTLGSEYFTTKKNARNFLYQWVDSVKKAGIEVINGAVIGDASIYSADMTPPTWSWEDMSNYFGAGACGLTVFDNMYKLYMKTGFNDGDSTWIVRMEPTIPGMKFDNQVRSSNTTSDDSYIFGEPYYYFRTIRGFLPKGKSEFDIGGAMPDPAFFAAYELTRVLQEAGIKVVQQPTTVRELVLNKIPVAGNRKSIATIYSPVLSEIVKQTNTHSVNLFAEHFLTHAGAFAGKKADTKSGAEVVMKFWKNNGMDIDGLSINDGSGLSKYNTVTPRQQVFLLTYMKNKSKNFDVFYNSLSIAGKTGTLRGLCGGTKAQDNVHAKSGTIRRVKGYAGYVKSISGREIAFSMLVNNFNCPSYIVTKKLEQLMIAMANLEI